MAKLNNITEAEMHTKVTAEMDIIEAASKVES
jgi:hypothetical protein